MEKTLADLKVGDKVELNWANSNPSIAEVIGDTKTALRVTVGATSYLFKKDTGRHRIGDYSWAYIKVLTPERAAEIRRANKTRRLVSELRQYRYDSLPLETLEAIHALLPKETANATA